MEPCPYCHKEKPETAIKCSHCGGNTPRCPKCKKNVAVAESDKFVGLVRGGTQKVGKCNICGTRLYGPECFVATAVYGDSNHPDVVSLRRFRDTYLSSSHIGRLTIDLYYVFGPKLASFFRQRKILLIGLRYILSSAISILKR